jgi:solute:Na+ symporter, SSS family
VALGYENGISGMWLVFWIGMGVIALGVLMSTRLSRLGVYTVAEMLENRYGSASRLISAIIIAAYALMIAVTSTIAIGTVFNVVLGLSPASQYCSPVALSSPTPWPAACGQSPSQISSSSA